MEYTINLFFSITDFWTKAKDPTLDEYRWKMRNIITFTIMSISSVTAMIVISPSSEPVQGMAIITYQVNYYLSLGLLVAFLCFSIASLWSCLMLYLFFRKNGLND